MEQAGDERLDRQVNVRMATREWKYLDELAKENGWALAVLVRMLMRNAIYQRETARGTPYQDEWLASMAHDVRLLKRTLEG